MRIVRELDDLTKGVLSSLGSRENKTKVKARDP